MRLSRFSLLIISVTVSALLSSCATMFHHGPAEVRIVGPDSMHIMTFDSVELGVSGKNNSQVIIPPRGSDSLLLEYKGKHHTVYLEKQFNPNVWLNLLLYGWIGFGVDDISQSWFDYRYMTAIADTNDNLHVYAGMKEQKALYDRPRLLLMGGEVLSWRSLQPGTSSFVIPGGSANFDFEAAAGLDLYNQMQLFFRTRSSISTDNYYGYDPYGPYTESFSVSGVNGVAMRMLRSRFFLEGSYNWSTVSKNAYYGAPYYNSSSFSKDISLVGVALGYAGDITYLSLEYMMETRPFTIDGRTYSNRRLTLSYGVNWKF